MKPHTPEALIQFLEGLTEIQQNFFLDQFCGIMDQWFSGDYLGKAKSKWPDLVVGSKYTELDALSVMLLHLRPYFPPLISNVPVYRITHVEEVPDKPVVMFSANKQLKPLTSWTTRRVPQVINRKKSKLCSIILEHDLKGSTGVLTDYEALGSLYKCMSSHGVTVYLKRKGMKVFGLPILNQSLRHFAIEREVLMYTGSTPVKCTWRHQEDTSVKTKAARVRANVKPHTPASAVSFLKTLDHKELDFFCSNFFQDLTDWFQSTYYRETKKPDLIVGSKYLRLDAFAIMLLHLRPYFPPMVTGKTIRRVSNVNAYPTRRQVLFHPNSQHKSLTSWTCGFVPDSVNRDINGDKFIVYEHHLEGSKGVLTDYLALASVANAFDSQEVDDYLRTRNQEVYDLRQAARSLKQFRNEQEVLMYTSKSQPFKCTWFKSDKDGIKMTEHNAKVQIAASASKAEIHARIVGSTFYFGLKWDKYTAQVESQITKDLIAMIDQAQTLRLDLVAVCESNEADRVLLSLGVKRLPLSTFATMWILYQTIQDSEIEVPDHAINVLVREMFITVAPAVIDTGPHSGFALQPQGRVAPPRLGVNRPAPNSTAKPDYALIMLWC